VQLKRFYLLPQGERPDSGPTPPDLSNKVHNFVPGVLFDTAGLMHRFGDCLQHPPSKVKRGTTVSAKFVSFTEINNFNPWRGMNVYCPALGVMVAEI
jgi:hypothetical protein